MNVVNSARSFAESRPVNRDMVSVTQNLGLVLQASVSFLTLFCFSAGFPKSHQARQLYHLSWRQNKEFSHELYFLKNFFGRLDHIPGTQIVKTSCL